MNIRASATVTEQSAAPANCVRIVLTKEQNGKAIFGKCTPTETTSTRTKEAGEKKTRPLSRSHLVVTYRKCYFYTKRRVGENQYSRLARLKKTSRQDKKANRLMGERRGLKSSQHPTSTSPTPRNAGVGAKAVGECTNTTNCACVPSEEPKGHVRATSSCH